LGGNQGLQKSFGVYTFDDNRPLFEKKARLIERIAGKKEDKRNLFGEPIH